MRRHTVSTLVLVGLALAPLSVSAQRSRYDKPTRYYSSVAEIGLIGGPNRNTVTGANEVEPKVRGSIGGFLSVPVFGAIRLRPEVSVSGKKIGVLTDVVTPCIPPANCNAVEETATFTWLEVPLLVETRFGGAMGGWGSPRLYAGPFVAVRLACSFATPVGGTTTDDDEPRVVRPCNDQQSRYNNGDAGVVVGGSIGAGPVGIGLRWTRSLVPIAPSWASTNGVLLAGAKHSTLGITVEFATRLH